MVEGNAELKERERERIWNQSRDQFEETRMARADLWYLEHVERGQRQATKRGKEGGARGELRRFDKLARSCCFVSSETEVEYSQRERSASFPSFRKKVWEKRDNWSW